MFNTLIVIWLSTFLSHKKAVIKLDKAMEKQRWYKGKKKELLFNCDHRFDCQNFFVRYKKEKGGMGKKKKRVKFGNNNTNVVLFSFILLYCNGKIKQRRECQYFFYFFSLFFFLAFLIIYLVFI